MQTNDSNENDSHAKGSGLERSGSTEVPPRFHVTDLVGGGSEAVLVHMGQEYRLRITSNGKLILTK
jgi:hemin uptake protein HemP